LTLLLEFGVYVSKNEHLSSKAREMGLSLLEILVNNRRKYFKKKTNLQKVIEAAYLFSCNEKYDENSDWP